jgi:type I restriction enzyme, S subunit
MREMKKTGIEWLPEISKDFSIGYVKQYFNISKDLSNEGEPERVLKLARSGIVEKDVTMNEGQMAASYSGYNKVLVGDLVLNPMDLYSGANCNVSELDGVISPAYSNLRAKKAQTVVPKFYDYYFKTQYWLMAMFAHGKGVSFDNRWTLNNDSLRSYEIPVLPYLSQKRIVKKVHSEEQKVDALIANQQAQIEKLRAYKQSLITEVVTHGLDPDAPMKDSGVEWIGMIPQGWKISSVRYIGTLQNGISKGGDAFGSGYPFVSYGDVYKNYELPVNVNGLIETNEKERNIYSVEYGDIFFTRTSETIEEVGFSCVCKQTIPNATFAGFVIRLRPQKADEKIITDYAKYYFRGNHIRAYLVKEMNLVTRASLGQTLLKGMPITLPPKEEQQQIADYLDTKCAKIDALIAIKQQKIEKLTQYKKSLIYEYVTGKKEAI